MSPTVPFLLYLQQKKIWFETWQTYPAYLFISSNLSVLLNRWIDSKQFDYWMSSHWTTHDERAGIEPTRISFARDRNAALFMG